MFIRKKVNKFGSIYLNNRGIAHREDGPAIEYVNGDKCWFINGKRHKEGGPAIDHVDGHKEWYINGELHREDGPAVERINGLKQYFLKGIEYKNITSDEEWIKLVPKILLLG
jgi:hypothetical protein